MAKQKWQESGERFINPYTFASLGGEVERAPLERGDLTGRISCTLTVKSELAVPDTTAYGKTDVEEHFRYPFFTVNGVPVIPGSQLRGVIRSAYETLTNSCLSVNNNNVLSARHTAPRKPGILVKEDGVWHLYNAVMRKVASDGKAGPNQVIRVWHDLRDNVTYHCFTKSSEVPCSGLAEAVEDYCLNVKEYEDGKSFNTFLKKLEQAGASRTYGIEDKSKKDRGKEGKLYPVFYEIVRGKSGMANVYLAPSQFGRSVFSKKLDDLLGSHRSCSKRNDELLCKACSLFGTLTASKTMPAVAGSVRFSDAIVQEGTFQSAGYALLRELSGPKTTSTEFYTKRPPKALHWTYESMTTGYRSVPVPGRPYPDTVPERVLTDVEISGRKMYYHSPVKLQKSDYTAPKNECTNRNSTMELCKPGAVFTFDVYFEQITRQQLHELVWTLTLGENTADSNMQHKLGHGKPLGLGDIKITVDGVAVRRFDGSSYEIEQIAPEEFAEMPFDREDAGVQEFLQIVNTQTLAPEYRRGIRLGYPLADNGRGGTNGAASHQWFIANRQTGKGGSPFRWSINHTLPRVGDKDRSLPGFEQDSGFSGGSWQSYGQGKKNKR